MIGRTRIRERMRSEEEAAGGAPARRRNLFAQVLDELGRRVVRGDFDSSGVLPIEPRLAAELGVSRNLLREAVKVLAGKGLLEVRPKSGTRLRARPDWHLLDPDVLAWLDASGHGFERSFELVEFRLIVEPKASYLAAAQDGDLGVLEDRELVRDEVGQPPEHAEVERHVGDRVAGRHLLERHLERVGLVAAEHQAAVAGADVDVRVDDAGNRLLRPDARERLGG